MNVCVLTRAQISVLVKRKLARVCRGVCGSASGARTPNLVELTPKSGRLLDDQGVIVGRSSVTCSIIACLSSGGSRENSVNSVKTCASSSGQLRLITVGCRFGRLCALVSGHRAALELVDDCRATLTMLLDQLGREQVDRLERARTAPSLAMSGLAVADAELVLRRRAQASVVIATRFVIIPAGGWCSLSTGYLRAARCQPPLTSSLAHLSLRSPAY